MLIICLLLLRIIQKSGARFYFQELFFTVPSNAFKKLIFNKLIRYGQCNGPGPTFSQM